MMQVCYGPSVKIHASAGGTKLNMYRDLLASQLRPVPTSLFILLSAHKYSYVSVPDGAGGDIVLTVRV